MVGANHLVPWWRPELLAKSWQKTTAGWHAGSDFQVEKEASQSAAMHPASVCTICIPNLRISLPIPLEFFVAYFKVHREPLTKVQKKKQLSG